MIRVALVTLVELPGEVEEDKTLVVEVGTQMVQALNDVLTPYLASASMRAGTAPGSTFDQLTHIALEAAKRTLEANREN